MSQTAKHRPILGCDIGNGFGYVSLLQQQAGDPLPLLPSKYQLSNLGMPTTAYVTPPDGTPIVVFQKGKTAEKQYQKHPKQLVHAVKTRLKEGSIALPEVEKPVPVAQLYGAIARDLVTLAEEELKNKGIDPIYDLVFTFPASFADDTAILEQMQQAIQAVELDGHPLRVLSRLPEPAAVAIDYLHYMQHIAPEDIRLKEERFTVLVYDLGHGTFDTAVVTAQSKGSPYQLHAKNGLPEVGGKDFDQLLYEEFCRQLLEQYDYAPKNERDRQKILQAAIQAKFELTDGETSVQQILVKGEYLEVEVTRARFEELSQHLMFQTLELVQNVLEESEANGITVQGIVLSGGASKMPMVKRNLEALVEGAMPVVLYRPSEAVSYGAARFAYGIQPEEEQTEETASTGLTVPAQPVRPNPVLEQFTDCGYGIWMPAEGKLDGEVRFLVGSGARRPAVSHPVSVVSQSSCMVIKLYRSQSGQEADSAADETACRSMLWFPFAVTAGQRYQVRLIVREDYSVVVELTDEAGNVTQKSTSDLLSKLI